MQSRWSKVVVRSLSIAIAISGLTVLPSVALAGATPSWSATFVGTPSSVVGDNVTTITISVHAYTYLCTPTNPDNPVSYATDAECIQHAYTGSVPVPADNVNVFLANTGVGYLSSQMVTTDSQGNASITTHAPSAGSEFIGAYYSADFTQSDHGNTTVHFTAPTPAPKAATTSTIGGATPKPTPAPTVAPTASPVTFALAPSPSPTPAVKTSVLSSGKIVKLSVGLIIFVGLVSLAIWYGLKRVRALKN
ncbi:hypothetical protein HJC99_06410 [Candidatus Saccharibacteria bacterium]|nr:hypothetical protein [Candidatus Saccharibacteria bacterium]